MAFTQEQILHLAKLAGLAPTDDLFALGKDLDSIVAFIDTLGSIDDARLDRVRSSAQLPLPPREDTVGAREASADELLACSPQKVVQRHIAIDAIFSGS